MTHDETRQTARAIADMTEEAYRADVATGLAPGITLADLIETAIRDRDEEHAGSMESQRALGRAATQRAERAEARVAELEAALRGLVDSMRPDADSDDRMGGTWGIAEMTAAESALEPAPTPRSALCHHQDRPHCAGCPDDATCEASGREPRGTP